MLNYLCVGLGVFLAIYVINLADPKSDLGFFEGIVNFLVTLFSWPLTLVANMLLSLQVRKQADEIEKLIAEAVEKLEDHYKNDK